jgi:uncharacterized membrane protein (UPF0182 family)
MVFGDAKRGFPRARGTSQCSLVLGDAGQVLLHEVVPGQDGGVACRSVRRHAGLEAFDLELWSIMIMVMMMVMMHMIMMMIMILILMVTIMMMMNASSQIVMMMNSISDLEVMIDVLEVGDALAPFALVQREVHHAMQGGDLQKA